LTTYLIVFGLKSQFLFCVTWRSNLIEILWNKKDID